MEKNQFLAIVVVVLVVAGEGVVFISVQDEKPPLDVEMNVIADDMEAVCFGFPETGFWGDENGAIDWKPLPFHILYYSFDNDSRTTSYEFWFRERYYNGTQWEYNNHGPFFVTWPQISYYKEISLNNHTVYISIGKLV